jgi:hypothetical protein
MDQNSRYDIEEQGGVAVVMIYEGQQQWTGVVTPLFFGDELCIQDMSCGGSNRRTSVGDASGVVTEGQRRR